MSKKTKECPFCAETIKAEAIVCRYCRRDLVKKNTEAEIVEAEVIEPGTGVVEEAEPVSEKKELEAEELEDKEPSIGAQEKEVISRRVTATVSADLRDAVNRWSEDFFSYERPKWVIREEHSSSTNRGKCQVDYFQILVWFT